MVTAISIIRWVCRDPQLLGSLVNFDESSASISAAPNQWDSAGDKRWREDGERGARRRGWWGGWRKGDKALAAFNELDQSPRHLPASALCPGACITMSASDKSHIPAHQQQIVIGIPFMSHHMPSYPLWQKKDGFPTGWNGWPEFPNKLVPMKRARSIWNSQRSVSVCLFEYQKGLAWGLLTVKGRLPQLLPSRCVMINY